MSLERDAVKFGAVALGAWLLFEWLKKKSQAPINAIAGAIAHVYEALTFAAPIQVEGDLDDVNGNYLGPVSSFPAATDSQGNTYLTVAGMVYQLGPRDSHGNFTALPTGMTPAQAAQPGQ